MGAPLALLSIIGLSMALVEWKHGDKILIALALPYLLFIGLHKLKFARHLLLIYPVLTIFAATVISDCRWQAMSILRRNLQKWRAWFVYTVLGAVGIYSMICTAAFASVMATPPTMVEASEWIDANVPSKECLQSEPEILFDWLLPKLDRGCGNSRAELLLGFIKLSLFGVGHSFESRRDLNRGSAPRV